MSNEKRSWVEISLPALEANVALIRKKISPACGIIAVVKGDAYGHGIEPIARTLQRAGIESFGVADVGEACALREILPRAEITVFGGCDPGDQALFIEKDLTAALFDERPLPSRLKVQVKIDTGMGRLGFPWTQARKRLCELDRPIRGVYSTLACADCDPAFTELQISRFLEVTDGLNLRRHLSNSAGLQFAEANFEAVRPGLALYGILPVDALTGLRPVLSWKARLIAVNEVSSGTTVGYGATFSTSRPSRIGVLPVGYADGYSRAFSNRGRVRCGSGFAPIVGRVSMDLTMVDLTDMPSVGIGDEMTLLDADARSPISASALARMTGTIPYEVLTTIGRRVKRTYRTD